MKLYLAGTVTLVMLSSCSSWLPTKNSASAPNTLSASTTSQNPGVSDTGAAKLVDPDGENSPKTASEIENLTIGEVIRMEEPNTQNLYDNSRYDFPITMNSRVEGWIDYFTGRGRPHMERYLSRSGRYLPSMKKILKNASMPEDLVYLALIESGFNLRAKSRAKAVGPWQFMKATGQRYGLRVDGWIDERRDPIRSTEAAAKYLKDLYLMFESWYLAASAYNAGEYKILRGIEQLKTNNYWNLCETNFLRRETKDYIPKLIAAAIIAKNAERYGFEEVDYQEPLEFETITVDFPIHLKEIAKLVDVSEEDVEDLNPELRRAQVPPNTTYEVRVPIGSRTLAERGVATLREQYGETTLPTQHVVKNGETLISVSKKYRVRLKDVAEINNLNPKEKLSPGLSLIIPKRSELQSEKKTTKRTVSAVAPSSSESTTQGNGFLSHTVKRGESLWSIAEKYNVTVQEIFRWNGLKRSQLQVGRKLKIKAQTRTSEDA